MSPNFYFFFPFCVFDSLPGGGVCSCAKERGADFLRKLGFLSACTLQFYDDSTRAARALA